MAATMGIVVRTGALGSGPEKAGPSICHECDQYPCACSKDKREWKYKINGRPATFEEAYAAGVDFGEEASPAKDKADAHWKEDMRMRDLINTMNGRIL